MGAGCLERKGQRGAGSFTRTEGGAGFGQMGQESLVRIVRRVSRIFGK